MSGVKVARKKIEGLDGHMPAVDAAYLTLHHRFAGVEALLPIAAQQAQEDEEYIHQLRVASRRADAALRIFRSFVKAKLFRKARKALRKIRRAAGDARACDVQIGMLCRLSTFSPNDQHQDDPMVAHRHAAIARLIDAINTERHQAQIGVRKAAAKYHSRKLSELQGALLDSIGPVDLGRQSEGELAMTFAGLARKQLMHFGRMLRERANEIQTSDVSIADLHALRIRAKRLRYAMEVFAPCAADGLKSAYLRIEAMQDALGDINDLDDLAKRLNDAIQRSAKASSKEAVFSLTLEEHAALDALRQQLKRDRDAQADQFARDLSEGVWSDVVEFDSEIAEYLLTHEHGDRSMRDAEVHG